MTIYLLDERIGFPDPACTDDATGVLAVGGDLSPERLLLGYSLGIFPWYDDELSPILWHCPALRFVLAPEDLHLGRTLRKTLRKHPFQITYNRAFSKVIHACAKIPRAGQTGTWLNEDMIIAYTELHRRGYAHSAEAWFDGEVVGGLYGVTLGGVFFGESMFSSVADASKAIFADLVPRLAQFGYGLIDCQVYTEHLHRFGARDVSRSDFLSTLAQCLDSKPSQVWPSSLLRFNRSE